MLRFQISELKLGGLAFHFAFAPLQLFLGRTKCSRVLLAHCAFSNRNDAEVRALFAAAPNSLGNDSHVVGNFRYQDNVRPAGDSRAQSEPTGPVAHDFGHNNTVVAMSSAVQAIDGFRRNSKRGVKTY